jgi:AcrR family transcriptional regulator
LYDLKRLLSGKTPDKMASPSPRDRPAAEQRTYFGQTGTERDDARRQRLLDAGLEIFGTVGYSTSAIEAICGQAQVSTRHFYAAFPNKEALLLAVDERITIEAADQIRSRLAEAPPDVAARCRVGLRAYADVFIDDPRKARVHFFEVLSVAGGDAGTHRRVTGAQLMEIFLKEGEQMMRAKMIARRDLTLTSVALLGATRYAMTDWILARDGTPIEAVVDELTRLFVSAFGAEPTGRPPARRR